MCYNNNNNNQSLMVGSYLYNCVARRVLKRPNNTERSLPTRDGRWLISTGLYQSTNLLISTANGVNKKRQLEGLKDIPRTRQVTSSRTKGIPLFSNMLAPVRLRVDSLLCGASSSTIKHATATDAPPHNVVAPTLVYFRLGCRQNHINCV